ncbi:hypothetical protein CRUP_012782 [Coryphaenoides rupestris]|nr:hypothetical protein CRUP_012782 [Coryphaenoides rupestris]
MAKQRHSPAHLLLLFFPLLHRGAHPLNSALSLLHATRRSAPLRCATEFAGFRLNDLTSASDDHLIVDIIDRGGGEEPKGNQKYKAGHSFQMDPCQMCYCPNVVAAWRVRPSLDVVPHGGKKAIPGPVTKDSDPLQRDISRPPDNEQIKPLEPSSELPLGNTLPLYKQDPLSFGLDEYDRNQTMAEPKPSLPLDRHRIRESTPAPLTHSEGGFASSSTSRGDDRRREEPGDTPGSQDLERKHKGKAHHHHHHHHQQQQQQHVEPMTAGARNETLTSVQGTNATAQRAPTESPRLQQEASGKNLRHHRGDRRERVTVLPAPADKEGRQHGHSHHGHKTTSPVNSSVPVASHAQGHEGQPEAPREGQRPYQTVQLSPARRAAVRIREDKGDKPRRQAQTHHNFPPQTAEEETGVTAKELVTACCETGEKWATDNGDCDRSGLPGEERHAVCRTAQKQCCLGALRHRRCLAGVSAAKSGAPCEDSDKCGGDSSPEPRPPCPASSSSSADDKTAQKQCCLGALRHRRCLAGVSAAKSGAPCEDSDKCGGDSYAECCGCCTLGLRFRSEGLGCEAHPHLGPRCRQSFLTCCRGEAEAEPGAEPGAETGGEEVGEEEVSDSTFPKEAFSIGGGEEEDEEEEQVEEEQDNAVERPFQVEDMDECAVYNDSLCHQRCVNTPGSFHCECFAGFRLQGDGITCAPETPARKEEVVEENGLEEHHKESATAAGGGGGGGGGVVEKPTTTTLPPPPPPTTTNTTTTATAASPVPTVPLDPCEGSHPCAQQCTPVAGRVQCSCFQGYALNGDGHSCEDVNECLSTRACLQSQRCLNTPGSYVCQRQQLTCPPGYQVNDDLCEGEERSESPTR